MFLGCIVLVFYKAIHFKHITTKGESMNIKLKTKFIERKKSQRKVALNIGIPETRMSEFVQEVRNPTYEQKQAIATELGCKVEDIF
jgi:DNA-binding Xre family transcriptional regulator